MTAIIFDLDQTLVDSTATEAHRSRQDWSTVLELTPKVIVYEGVPAILEMLEERQVPVAIVTKSRRVVFEKIVDHHKMRVTIKTAVCGAEGKPYKPDPASMLKAANTLKVEPKDVWAVGDDPRDILAAHNAGMHSVAVTWGSSDKESLLAAGAERVFHTVSELHAFLDELTAAST